MLAVRRVQKPVIEQRMTMSLTTKQLKVVVACHEEDFDCSHKDHNCIICHDDSGESSENDAVRTLRNVNDCIHKKQRKETDYESSIMDSNTKHHQSSSFENCCRSSSISMPFPSVFLLNKVGMSGRSLSLLLSMVVLFGCAGVLFTLRSDIPMPPSWLHNETSRVTTYSWWSSKTTLSSDYDYKNGVVGIVNGKAKNMEDNKSRIVVESTSKIGFSSLQHHNLQLKHRTRQRQNLQSFDYQEKRRSLMKKSQESSLHQHQSIPLQQKYESTLIFNNTKKGLKSFNNVTTVVPKKDTSNKSDANTSNHLKVKVLFRNLFPHYKIEKVDRRNNRKRNYNTVLKIVTQAVEYVSVPLVYLNHIFLRTSVLMPKSITTETTTKNETVNSNHASSSIPWSSSFLSLWSHHSRSNSIIHSITALPRHHTTHHRVLEDNNNRDNGEGGNDDVDDDSYFKSSGADNELCSTFLVSFLEGTTDARDTCEGIMNAYVAADCLSRGDGDGSDNDLDYDDYFQDFTEHQCCQALQQHHSDYCEEDNLLSNFHLFVAAVVLLLCECAKAAVVHYKIHFLPEAGVCILVGTAVGSLIQLISNIIPSMVVNGTNIDELSFDDELFMSLLLPPIIFEAALSVSKFEFKRRRGAIFMFSVFGTVISTFSTGLMVHYVSKWSTFSQTFPMLDSLVFGALISSIDPVAILSVLTNLNLDQRDTIFILVFGESLLNDGIAITVFQTLVNRFDGKTKIYSTSLDEILDACATFMIAMFGSIVVGIASGCGAWAYFNMLGKLLPPVMEVGSFFLWALIPYYICDGVGWSGIVSIVVVGFFMDIYIAGPKGHNSSREYIDSHTTNNGNCGVSPTSSTSIIVTGRRPHHQVKHPSHPLYNGKNINDDVDHSSHSITTDVEKVSMPPQPPLPTNSYRGMVDDSRCKSETEINPNTDDVDNETDLNDTSTAADLNSSSSQNIRISRMKSMDSNRTNRSIGPLPSTERINMSVTADRHVRFVAHLTSQLAENAIFSYIGLFLFSNNYDWNPSLIGIAVSSCILSRMIMVVVVSYLMYHIYRCRGVPSFGNNSSRTAAAIQNPRTQAVLVLAGLRGAVSLALVENVPIYNNVTGEGCEFKQVMKGMTSACILFTTFVFGGGAYYILPHLGIRQDHNSNNHNGSTGCDRGANSPMSVPGSPVSSSGTDFGVGCGAVVGGIDNDLGGRSTKKKKTKSRAFLQHDQQHRFMPPILSNDFTLMTTNDNENPPYHNLSNGKIFNGTSTEGLPNKNTINNSSRSLPLLGHPII